jgi:hypothetical protein
MHQISKGKIKNPRIIDGRPIFPVFVAILSFSFISNGTLCVTVVGNLVATETWLSDKELLN